MRRICQAKTAPIRATSSAETDNRPEARLVADGQGEEHAENEDP